MSLTMSHWMFSRFLLIGLLAQLLFQLPSASATSSALNCSVTYEPDGSFRHELSQRPTSPRCKTCWEDQNKTVIAHDSTPDPQLVQDLTDEFIVLRACRDYLHYTRDCFGVWEEAHCRVNCSLYLDRRSNTGICFGSWCPDNVTAGLTIGVPSAAIVLTLIIYFIIVRCRRMQSISFTSSYTCANEQIKVVTDTERQQ